MNAMMAYKIVLTWLTRFAYTSRPKESFINTPSPFIDCSGRSVEYKQSHKGAEIRFSLDTWIDTILQIVVSITWNKDLPSTVDS